MKLELYSNPESDIEPYFDTTIEDVAYPVRLSLQRYDMDQYQSLNIEMPYANFGITTEDPRLGDWNFIEQLAPKAINKLKRKQIFFNKKRIGYFPDHVKLTPIGIELSGVITMNGGNAIRKSVDLNDNWDALNKDFLP